MSISWGGLPEAVEEGSILYLADGSVRLRVVEVRPGAGEVEVEIEVGGAVASRQGLNIPGPVASLPAVPEEDLHLLRHGESIGVDMVALSFVQSPEDVEFVRDHTRLPLIAKMEKPQAVERAAEIVKAADCVMVARGDLGIELPIERVPVVQKQLLELAGWMARPSITATQMLDSMVSSSRPTRAEVADVANAILDGTDAVMLSQETAVGAYPVEAVEMMAAVAVQAESIAPYERWNESRVRRTESDPAHTIAHNLCDAARELLLGCARDPHPLGALGAARLRAPPDGADLRALARPRDRQALRADVGRAGRLDPPPRDHRGADRRRGPPRGGARLVQARRARRHHRRAALRASRHDQPLSDPGRLGLGQSRFARARRFARTRCFARRRFTRRRFTRRAFGERALRGGNLGFHDRLSQARDLFLEEGQHPLLITTDRACDALDLLRAQRLSERLDRGVGRDLLGLACVLGLGILQLLLLIASAAQRVQRTLCQRDRFLRTADDCLGGVGDRLRAWRRDRLSDAAEPFDAQL